MQVKDLMTESVVTVSPESSAEFAARMMARHNIGALPVCDGEGRLRGMVTDRDIVTRCIAAESHPSDTAARAALLMSGERVRRLPVVRRGVLVGMLSLGDLATGDRTQMEAGRARTEISSNLRRL